MQENVDRATLVPGSRREIYAGVYKFTQKFKSAHWPAHNRRDTAPQERSRDAPVDPFRNP